MSTSRVSFQFHIGSIQADRASQSDLQGNRFNSTLVRFKPAGGQILPVGAGAFQFHIGSIQAFLDQATKLTQSPFQFHIGSIQAESL